MIYFITGNKNKVDEARLIVPELNQLDIDLPEIQSLDAKEIIKAKLQMAFQHQKGEFIVEDTALYIKGLKGLPGPLVKWFLKSIGSEGIYKIAQAFNTFDAQAKCVVGYATSPDDIHYFEGVIEGEVVSPAGNRDAFGWDPIFKPHGFDKSFAQMSVEEKNTVSHRGQAFRGLKGYLESKKY